VSVVAPAATRISPSVVPPPKETGTGFDKKTVANGAGELAPGLLAIQCQLLTND
jgi:hypothetical protein